MELCDGNLESELISRTNPFSEEEFKQILNQLRNVFIIMDNKKIMHRDIKLENILIKKDLTNKNNKLGFIVKLSDFGFSKVMKEDITNSYVGTPITMAPEVLEKRKYSFKADVWSVGVISYQLLFKTLPFIAISEEDLLNKIMKSTEIKYSDNYSISPTLKNLLNNLLIIDPNKRYSWKDIINSPFLKTNKPISSKNKLNELKNIKPELSEVFEQPLQPKEHIPDKIPIEDKEYKHEPIEPIEKVDSGQIEKLVKGQNEKDLDLDLKMNLDLNLDKELINKIDKKEKISIFQDKDRYDHSFKSIY